jgi:hypothetical protein
MTQMPWMLEGWKRLGVAEIAGPEDHNDEILRWWDIIGLSGINDDEKPNCAAFTLAMLKLGGISIDAMPLKDRGAAIAFEAFGAPCDLREGAIVVTGRHDPRNPRARHVGFLLSWTADSVTLLNANVGNKVCVSEFPRSAVTAVRWPEYSDAAEESVPAPPARVPEPAAAVENAPLPIPRLNHPVWKLLAISRTVRGGLWSLLGGIILLFQTTLQFALDVAAKVEEMAPLKPLLVDAGANLSAIGFGFIVWGVSWTVFAKLTPKPKPEKPA